MGFTASKTVDIGDELPEIGLKLVDGSTVELSEQTGAPLVLVFLRGFF